VGRDDYRTASYQGRGARRGAGASCDAQSAHNPVGDVVAVGVEPEDCTDYAHLAGEG